DDLCTKTHGNQRGGSFEKFPSKQILRYLALESHPIFIPAGVFRRPETMPFPRQKEDYRSRLHLRLRDVGRFKRTFAARDIDNLEFIQHPAIAPGKIMMTRML